MVANHYIVGLAMTGWRKSFFIGFVPITLLIGAAGFYLNTIPARQMEQGQWVMHTHEVLNELETLSKQLMEAKALQGSYQQTHALNDYRDYSRTVGDIQQTLNTIQNLTKDNAEQQQRITPLHQSIASRLNRYTQAMDPKIATPPNQATDEGSAEIEAITKRIEAMRQEEEQLLQERVAHWHDAVEHTRLFFLIGIGVLYLLVLVAYMAIRREIQFREQMLVIESDTADTNMRIATRMTQVVEAQQEIIYQRLNLQNAMEVITKRTQAITHSDGAVIELLDGDDMVYRAAVGNMSPYVGLKLKAQGSLSGLCVKSGRALHCDDTDKDERVDREACRKVGVRSMIVVPLIQRGETVGVLKVAWAQPKAVSPEDLGMLQLMAGVLSATLRDAVASDALHDSHAHLSITNELLKTQKSQLEFDKNELKALADTDGMTGIKNHRFFQECLLQEFFRAKRYKNALSLVLIDVDHFKQYNDRYGHPAGDDLLKKLALLLKRNARPSDCVARYGGEEFAIILTQTPISGAIEVAERISKAIREEGWDQRPVTVSVGIAALEEGGSAASIIVDHADKALYQSKSLGRNRISAFHNNGFLDI